METLAAATQEDSSGANANSIKSEDSSPRHESGRSSPPPNCAICLGTCRNNSFTDSCLHQFCFKCLLTWSKVKAECPLCKQTFRSIIHNVKSNDQYEEYMVEQRQTEETTERIDITESLTTTRRFRYRTTLTLPRRESIAFQQLLLHYPLMADVLPSTRATVPRRRSPASFRRTVYRHNLWARPLPDFTGRFRDCSPVFYRYNDSQMHRLVPWLNRELHYLLNENIGHISYVISRILELLPQYHINSPEFKEAMVRYFGARTEHFLHEMYCFASTPYDITGYDRNVQYTTDTRISTMVNEVISSSESDASTDSDIVMVSSSEPAEPPPGPSRVPAPVYPQNYIPEPNTDNVIPIETFSQSDTDDDSSEVMVVGYIKPPQDRTPEVVDLLGSDSDVIVQENTPEPSQSHDNIDNRHVPLVKLSLKTHKTRECDSDSEDSSYRPPPSKRKRRHRSNDTATTTDTCRTTPSPARDWDSNSGTSSPQSTLDNMSPSSSTISSYSNYSASSSESYSSSNKRKKLHKKKPKRKNKEAIPSEKCKKKTKKRIRPQQKQKKAPKATAENETTKKNKSSSGKGVKSSKKSEVNTKISPAEVVVPAAQMLDQPSTSGTSTRRKDVDKDQNLENRNGRESRRLKSVVSVVNNQKNSSDSNSSASQRISNDSTTVINSSTYQPIVEEEMGRKTVITSPAAAKKPDNVTPSYGMLSTMTNDDVTDSEDDLPLNLTVQKKSPCL